MPTENPPAPPTQEMNISSLGKGGKRGTVPPETLAAINAAASQRGGKPAEAIALPEPPPDPAPPVKTPPAPNGEPKEAPKPPAAPPPTPPAPKDPPTDESKGVKSLREALERRTKEFEALQVSHTATAKEKAEADLKRAEADAKLQAALEREEKEYKPRIERLKVAEQELQKKEEILRIKDYTSTNEFHEKFVKPLSDAQAEVQELLGELTVPQQDGTQRVATIDDFNEILSARSLNEAHAIAQAKFGPIAPNIVNYRTRIRGLERNRQEAVKNAGLASAEFEKQQQAQAAQFREGLRNSVYQEAQRLIAESSELNIPETDEELRSVMQAATRDADELLEGNQAWTPEVLAKKVAKGRVRMIKADVLEKKFAKAQSRIAELEEQLKAYQRSEPEIETRRNGGPAPSVNGDKPEKQSLLAAAQAIAAKRGG